jgi:hypothetical protein
MTEIEKAERFVNRGRDLVTEQRQKVCLLRAAGGNTNDAEEELRLFEDSLAIFEDHLRWLQTAHA